MIAPAPLLGDVRFHFAPLHAKVSMLLLVRKPYG